MRATTQEFPLSPTVLLRHGANVHGDATVVSWERGQPRRRSFEETAARVSRLASGLLASGIGLDGRVASFCRNHAAHLESYWAVPAIGATLFTVNPRMTPSQVGHVLRVAGPEVLVVDASLLPSVVAHAGALANLRLVVVVDDEDEDSRAAGDLGAAFEEYEAFVARADDDTPFATVDERQAAVVCFTSGTTGDPKGVAYSHRGLYLHAVTLATGNVYGLTDRDRVLLIVPLYHANAWGLPHAAWLSGADIVLPGRDLSAAALARTMVEDVPTVAAAVPTIWSALLEYADEHGLPLSELRLPVSGGSALPSALAEAFELRHGLRLRQGWGLTETMPLLALANPPAEAGPDDAPWRLRAGRVVPGVELRLRADDGTTLPWDDASVGAIEVRGPWTTGRYLGDPEGATFEDGWFRTGDVGRVDDRGYVTIVDREKDLIKSGGEWISSIELEEQIRSVDGVLDVAVVAVPDDVWQERPLACVVLRECGTTPQAIARALAPSLPRWWMPERWTVLPELPCTSVGKPDKRALRRAYEEARLAVIVVDR